MSVKVEEVAVCYLIAANSFLLTHCGSEENIRLGTHVWALFPHTFSTLPEAVALGYFVWVMFLKVARALMCEPRENFKMTEAHAFVLLELARALGFPF
jgi:hypothetical protein